jgi:hypothetical protein
MYIFAATMSTNSAVGDGGNSPVAGGTETEEREITMAEMAIRFKKIEDMLHPLVPLADQVIAIGATVAEMG